MPAIKQIERAIAQCNTRNISNKTTELSDKHVISSLGNVFNNELQGIVGKKVTARLEKSGTKQGVPHSRIILLSRDGRPFKGKLIEVLSEGEFRGVSLAGFFAELTVSGNSSTVVFDDPVSSLDHVNARRIADRIADEADKRQIIVFTHDILFVSYLMERVNKDKILLMTLDSLEQDGIMSVGLPFDKMSVKERIGKLKDTLQSEIGPAYRKSEIETYKKLAGQFYRDLRMAWERAVEEILFGDVVKRYSHSVSTQQLRNVKYTPENAKIIEDNMTHCSNYLHDPAQVEPVDFGSPEDLAASLKALEQFRYNNRK